MASADVLSPSPGGGAIDVSRLANFLSLPEDVVTSFASNTEDYITSVLRSLDEKSRQHDNLRADALRIEVELEQAVRTADSRVKAMKTQLDSSLAETQDLRVKLNASESTRSSIEAEFSAYKSSRSDVDEEVRVLKIRVQTLESDKRDTLDALDRKSTDYDRLQDEYAAAQSKAIETRREASALETQLQQAQSAQTTAKFREQSLAQEVELLKKNNEWLDGELKTKVSEFQKFRKEKAAQVATLQRELDDALASDNSTKRNMEILKQRFEEVSKKAQDALAKVQELQNQELQREESFSNEMNSQKRLAELFEQSNKKARARIAELEQIIEQGHEQDSIELGRARAEAETEQTERYAAERRVAELEVQVERLEAELSTYAAGGFIVDNGAGSRRGSMNGSQTPTRRPGSAMGTPGGLGSPAAARLQKSGLSITQLYSDYTAMKASFEAEKRRNSKLEEAINDLMQDLEHKAPEIQELREEHDRLQKDLVEMSLLCEDAAKEKDKTKKEARRLEAKIAEHERESAVLRQQLRDLSNQVQVLLVEIEHRDSGADPLTVAQNRVFEQIVSGEMAEGSDTDTDRLISQRLTVFRGVRELQEQNEHLLKGIRELGQKMEREEEQRRQNEEGKEGQEIAHLKSVVERLKDELKTLGTKAQSFLRERDMFRRMLQNREGPVQQQEEEAPKALESDAGSQAPQVNLGEVIRDLQSQYDQFKTEALENHNTLNEQARRLAAEKAELGMQYARANSQLELATERYEMLNGNFHMLKEENDQLRSRISSMGENHAKQDLKTQQVAEELVDCKSLIEGMRTENANLKAEKTLWKNIEQRLAQDNEALTQERARLNGLIANLQSIQSERERADSETRRRLMSQTEKIENELQQTKRRLNEEVEEAKKLVIRKEIDARESQKKIDELNAAMATTRENLVAAKTSQDHLQTRVNELTVELKAAEEKLQVYQPKPDAPVPTEEEDDDMEVREQELQLEVAELKRTLEFTREELENVKTQVEQYKEIAQGAEEELQNMNDSHDEYRESMEQQLTEHQTKIKDLEQRLADTLSELSSANRELAQLQQKEVEQGREFENERKILQAQIEGLKEDLVKKDAAAVFYQEDLRSQAKIAQDAQQNYEQELVKHASAAKSLQQVREEYSQLRTEVHQIRAEAESAKAMLSSSETSWEAQKDNYEKELAEVKIRCDDLVKQNKILLGQLDNVTVQVSTLQKNRATADEMGDSAEHDALDKKTEDLREVIKYLRREKEIVDVQYELCLQESKRLRQQLDYSKATVDETRLLLAQERQREADQLRGATQHKELMEKISELNLLRESNTALRSDAERKGKKVQELEMKIGELRAKIEPLEDQVRNLEEEREQKDKEIKLLTEHGERWQARAQQILNKYDRIDPADLETLKEQAKSLQEQVEAVTAERDNLNTTLQGFELAKQSELKEVAEVWRKVVIDTKQKFKESRDARAQLETELEGMRAQLTQAAQTNGNSSKNIDELQQKIATTERQMEAHKTNAKKLYLEVRTVKEQYEQAQQEIAALKAEKAATPVAPTAPVAPIAVAAPVNNEAAIEAEVARRLAAIPPPDISAAVEAEVRNRMAQIVPSDNTAVIEAAVAQRIAQMPPPDNSAAIEAEVQRRLSAVPAGDNNAAAIEAEVQRRMALIPPPDNTAAIEAEVNRRIAEFQASQPVQTESAVAAPTGKTDEEVEAIVRERLAAEQKKVDARLAKARTDFAAYKATAVKTALDAKIAEFNEQVATTEAEHKRQIAQLQATIEELKKEIATLRQQYEQVKSELETAKATATTVSTSSTNEEELRKALEAKELEHQQAIEKLKQEEQAKIEEAKTEVTHQLQADFLARNTEPDATRKPPPTKEELTAIIKKNVEHRLVKERAKWEAQVEAEREKLVEERVNIVVEERVNIAVEERVNSAIEEKMKVKESELQATLEKSKDALRQEGQARIKVQLNMLEKKNKVLEEKLKAATDGSGAPAPSGIPTPGQQIPLPQSGLRPPGMSAIPHPNQQQLQQQLQQQQLQQQQLQQQQLQQQHQQQQHQQGQQGQDMSQIPIPPTQRRDAVGTGPAALRSLRGALSSNIPRGGAGRGVAQGGRGGSQAGSPTQTHAIPQQFPQMGQPQMGQQQIGQQQMGVPPGQQPQFGQRMSLPTGQPQTQLPRGGGMTGRGGIFRPQGRGAGGQGQNQGAGLQMQQPQQVPNIQTGLPMTGQQGSQQSPGRIMNPGARQFVPIKRSRDDGTEEDPAAGKRVRGGHNG